MKDKQSSEVIYALADYKQLVLTYRTKHAELVRALTFWKTSLIWLASAVVILAAVGMFWLQAKARDLEASRKNAENLKNQVGFVSDSLARAEKELSAAKEELVKKEAVIRGLEKNVSTASKELVEKLLIEKEEAATK